MISEAIARIKVYKKANEVHQISLASPLPFRRSLSLSLPPPLPDILSVDRAEGARRPICSTRELLREDRSARFDRPEVIAKIRVWQETNVVRREDRR